MSINISEFARANRPTVQIATACGNFVSGLFALIALFASFVFDPTDPNNSDANPAMFKLLLLTALVLFLMFLAGLAATCWMAGHHPVHVNQAKVRAAAWQRLNERHGVPIPEEPIKALVHGYRNNLDHPVAGDSATFDSMHPNGTPGKFIVRTDANGDIELFAAPGIAWVAVPDVDGQATPRQQHV